MNNNLLPQFKNNMPAVTPAVYTRYTKEELEAALNEELVEKDGMRPIRAILMLDWIRREPDAAFAYMAECTRRAPIMPLNSEELDEVKLAIERLKKQVKLETFQTFFPPVKLFQKYKFYISVNQSNKNDCVKLFFMR